MNTSDTKEIQYIPAKIFLEKYLPKELYYREEKLTGGGGRVMLYWKKEYQDSHANSTLRFFSEFGRVYLGEHNTNEPHQVYIKNMLERLYRCIKKLHKEPSFVIEELMKNIPWKRKMKTSFLGSVEE